MCQLLSNPGTSGDVLATRICPPCSTITAAGKAFLEMLGVFAEFETNLRKERQLEGRRQRRLASTRSVTKRKRFAAEGAQAGGNRPSPSQIYDGSARDPRSGPEYETGY
jgi:DNA invertase Pin-like site-specific DNA recombinase